MLNHDGESEACLNGRY